MLLKLSTYLQFDFSALEGGVTCEGVQSLVVLPTIYFIVSFVVILFDSSFYNFFKVAPTDYRHLTATTMHQFMPQELARVVEHFSLRWIALAIEQVLKTSIQVTIANLAFKKFIPYWKSTTPACSKEIQVLRKLHR